MKYLFVALLVVLTVLSAMTYLSYPDVGTDLPVVYWVTDPNPARGDQIAGFHRWLIENEYGEEVTLTSMEDVRAFQARPLTRRIREAVAEVYPEAERIWAGELEEADLPMTLRLPAMELRLDTGNREQAKQIIQGVSGVAGDIMDISGSGGGIRYFRDIGLLTDITEPARELGFDPSYTYEAMRPEIVVEGRQYAFPCNVYAHLLWVNEARFEELGVPLPPKRWTWEEFESLGKQFVEAANEPGERQRHFFAADVAFSDLRRSTGLSVFNETLTRPTLDDPRAAEALALKYKWVYEDNIIPTSAQRDAADTEAGYGGATLQLFNRGQYGMFRMGRYALIQLRRFGELDLTVVEPPHGGFPTVQLGTRAAGIYTAGENRDLAAYFLAYLASEDYNNQIVDDADALPPNPAFTDSEAFRRPERYPNEWGVHERFAEAAQTIAIGGVYSPYALDSVVQRHIQRAEQAVMNHRQTPEQAMLRANALIEAEIQRTLREHPGLREGYERRLERQAEIDQRREAGEPVPLEWIENPFYRRYYQEQGWVE